MARKKNLDEIEVAMIKNREQYAALKAQKETLIKDRNKNRKENRDHALIVGYATLLSYAGMDWTDVDWDKFEAYCKQYGKAFRKFTQRDAPATPEEANQELREWEKGNRAKN